MRLQHISGIKHLKQLLSVKCHNPIHKRTLTYVQGQEPEPKVREYFYYIDHQGMLFLDDARMKNFTSCFKEKKFLKFFFNQLRINNTERYKQFPYISPCGKERNYVRCDDCPFVYTHLLEKVSKIGQKETCLAHNHAGDMLTIPFEPHKVVMLDSGRVYHPAPERVQSIGLIQSKLAIEISKNFIFDKGEHKPPTHFKFNGSVIELNNEWYKNVTLLSEIRNKETV